MNFPSLDRLKDALKPWIFGIIHPWVYLATPLTSTDWDGDARSTTAKTLIDLSAVFAGIPAGVKAVLVGVTLRDSGSAASTGGCFLILSPNSTANSGKAFRCSGLANDANGGGGDVIPCDSNGDIYYQTNASGGASATLDVWLELWGWAL